MIDKERIKRCLALAPEIGLLEAVKKCDLNGEESSEILDLVMEAAATEKEDTASAKPALLPMILELLERQTRMEEQFEKLIKHLESVQTQLGHFADAMNMLTDVVHPGAPQAGDWKKDLLQGLREMDAGTKIVRLPTRRRRRVAPASLPVDGHGPQKGA